MKLQQKLYHYGYAAFTLKPSQIYWYALRRGLKDRKRYDFTVAQPLHADVGSCEFLAYTMGASQPQHFRFLNRERAYDLDQMDWSADEMPRLWRYNLHYFDYLQDTALSDDDKRQLMTDWVRQNPVGSVTAWEPYTLSLRVVNWIKFLLTQDDAAITPDILGSLSQQVDWLTKNLEWHILANHLFKNLKALVFAGCCLDGEAAKSWWASAEKHTLKQLDEQTLSDGGHYERSPMYHCLFLEDLLDMLQLVQRRSPDSVFAKRLRERATAAALFLRDITLPGGNIPLFNDAAFGIAPAPRVLMDYANRVLNDDLDDTRHHPEHQAFLDSGYFVLGDGADRMVIDCGETGPRYQPGHTHCDTLSFELTVAGAPLIVNSGTYDYEPGPRRTFDRSTQAHNTVRVDQQEQSEVWGLFRVARRARPVTACLETTRDGTIAFLGAHDGYQRLSSAVSHQRAVTCSPGKSWRVLDTLNGAGKHTLESFIHLHPDVHLTTHDQRLILTAPDGHTLAEITVIGEVEVVVSESVYHPEFGVELPNTEICLRMQTSLPVSFGYEIRVAGTN